jgi:IS5 family transposase
MWISIDALTCWQNAKTTGEVGHPCIYSDAAIQCTLTFKEVYHQPLRATEGLMQSVLNALHLGLKSPDYTTLCRRRKTLQIELPKARGSGMHLVVDSTGVKVFGEGEWKVRQHGVGKRRTWIKLHIGVNKATGEIAAAVVTDNRTADHEVLPALLEQILEPITQMSGDGAYDKRPVYSELARRKIRPTIPPRKGARLWQHGNSKRKPKPRDEAIRRIRQIGRKAWKQECGYHRRSLAETTMFRLKYVLGSSTRARSFEGQSAEILTRCKILNVMMMRRRNPSYRLV